MKSTPFCTSGNDYSLKKLFVAVVCLLAHLATQYRAPRTGRERRETGETRRGEEKEQRDPRIIPDNGFRAAKPSSNYKVTDAR